MSDEPENDPQEEVPAGMVEKRRKVRKKRRAKGSSSSANRVFEKGKDLLFGMQDAEEAGHVDVAEQLRRLKKDADEDKPLDDVWGSKRRSSGWLWILLLGIILPVVVIGIVVSKLTEAPELEPEVEPISGGGIEADDFSAEEGPHGWFLANSEEVTAEVIRILNAWNKAKSVEEVAPMIRQSPYQKLNPISLDKFSSPFIAETISDFNLRLGLSKAPGEGSGAERGFLLVSGKLVNGETFRACFVEDEVDGEKKVVLDWDGTTGWGEMTLEELIEAQPRNEVLVRCLIEKKPIYDLQFGEVTYSGYILSDPNTGDYTFAYVPLSSEPNRILNDHLKGVLDYGHFILPMQKNVPVTLKVRYGNAEGSSRVFEIGSLEQHSWVRP